MTGASTLDRLAAAKGVAAEWDDITGERQVTSPETKRALLDAMGVPAATERQIADALHTLQAAERARILPRECVLQADHPARIPLRRPAEWRLDREDGQVEHGHSEHQIELTLPTGLHRIVCGPDICHVIVAPPQAPSVPDQTGRPRLWGATGALYALQSPRNAGIGDYEDLATAAQSLAGLGADFLGINPVHASGVTPRSISPYAPSSRIALATRHIAIDRVAEFDHCMRARRVLSDNQVALAQARSGPFADYETAAHIVAEGLTALFETFETTGEATGRMPAFEQWWRERSDALEPIALFDAISTDHGADWRSWPDGLKHPGAPDVQTFRHSHSRDIRFQAWLQWLADDQLQSAASRARSAGMAFGLYLDIAVGVRPGGADCWARPDAFAPAVSLGAPPDAFNPNGQTWQLAPFSPDRLRDAGYAPFIDMLQATMRHAGLVRIDHVLGFARAFWVPEDGTPGGYVAYPVDSLLALTLIEAHRNGCVVVGEDLGSVPDGLRRRLADTGLLGCAVLQFEKRDDRFTPPQRYRAASIASLANHDTPTMRGWWQGRDIDQRVETGQITDDQAQDARQVRSAHRAALVRLLVDEGLWPEGLEAGTPPESAPDTILTALHALLARAPSALLAVQLDDALGQTEQQNLPGTIDEHPNWMRRHTAQPDRLHTVSLFGNIAKIMNAAMENDAARDPREAPCM